MVIFHSYVSLPEGNINVLLTTPGKRVIRQCNAAKSLYDTRFCQRHIRDHTFLQRFLGPIMSNHVQSQHDNRIQQTITPGHPRSTDALQHPESACIPMLSGCCHLAKAGNSHKLEVPSSDRIKFAICWCKSKSSVLFHPKSKSRKESFKIYLGILRAAFAWNLAPSHWRKRRIAMLVSSRDLGARKLLEGTGKDFRK